MLELVEFFLEKNVDFKSKDNEGNIPLVFAIRAKSMDLVKLIGPKMNNLRYTNAKGRSLIMEACMAGDPHIVKWLIDNRAPLNLKDTRHRSAFFYAKKTKNKTVMALLIKNGLNS